MHRGKVFYFISSKGIGITYHLSRLAKTFHTQGHYHYCFLGGENEQAPGIIDTLLEGSVPLKQFEGLESPRFKLRLKGMLACLRFLRTSDFQVLHTQTNFHLCLGILLKPFKKFKLMHTIHSFHNGVGGVKMQVNMWFLRLAGAFFVDQFFVPSRFVFNSFPGLQEKTRILYLGYDFDGTQELKEKVAGQTLKMVYCAKFHKAKNHEWLVGALRELLECGAIELFLPGDGSEFNTVKQLVNENPHIQKRVHLPGWLEQGDIRRLYAESDVALVPSSSETFGHNIVEPLSFSVPVIAFPVGIAPDIESGQGVTCVPFFDEKALKGQIYELYNDREKLVRAKANASDIFAKNFSWPAHLREYERVLD